MSTRSVILVTGSGKYKQAGTVRLYRHSDGYPTSVLGLIAEALTKALTQCAEHNQRFSEDRGVVPNVSQVVGLLIGAGSDVFGQSIRVDDDDNGESNNAVFNEKFKPKHLGNQGDLEWIYVIDLDRQSVSIYGGGFTGEIPQAAYKKGVVDPRSYANQLYDEYRASELEQIEEGIRAIDSTGFKINPRTKSKGKKVKESKVRGSSNGVVIPLKAAS